MSDLYTAKRIGCRQAYKAITAGLVIAYLIMAVMAGPFWIFEFDYSLTIIFSAIVLYGAGYLFGGLAGRLIILRKYPPVFVGLISGFLIIWSATLAGSLIGFFTESLSHPSPVDDPFGDYILKPVFIVSFFGFIPVAGIGIWYGISIKQAGKRMNSA